MSLDKIIDIHTFNVYDIIMKYKDLGKLIQLERKKRGWEQADLAALISREQQTISRWEKGDSRPKQDDLLRLVEFFSVDINVWLAKAGYQIEEPDISLCPYLPIHNLSPENFELFCRDFIKTLNPNANVSRYGIQGHKQDGIDLLAEENKKLLDYQCKRHKQFGPADVDTAVKNTTFDADYHYLLLSRIASPQSRKAMIKYSKWTLWDREDIASKVRDLPRDAAVRLVDTYFPGWRERFLGIANPSPWLTSEAFYLPLSDRFKLFSHGWSFVGRKKELDSLNEFKNQSNVNSCIISGRGGVGKSRLLKAWAEQINKTNTVRFVSPDSEVEQKDIELLPKGPSYLIIDDAHDRTDILSILNGVSRNRAEMKIILCSRPYGITRLEDNLTKTGLSFDDEKLITLNDLSINDARSLSEEILTDIKGDIKYAQRIAEITKDCPLATVIGSRLVGEKKIKPELLNNEKKFRDELLRSFRDVIAGKIGGSDAELIRDLLDFVATIQPFNPSDQNFQEVAEKLLNRHFDKITRDLSALEEAGVLSRRGYRLRIIPDLLADYIRTAASFDEKNNSPTGYVNRVFNLLKNELAINLLVNISQLDWRISKIGIQTTLLTDIWKKIFTDIKNANNADRTVILKKLEDVAYFQPQQLLELVEYIKENPSSTSEDSQYQRIYQYKHSDVMAELPEILKRISYHLEYLPHCVDLIWEISRGDVRKTNSHPDHGIRILQDLSKYDIYEITGKSVEVNKLMLNAVKRWISDPNAHNYVNSPLDILDEFLAKEAVSDTYNRGKITFYSLGVNYENTKMVREEALEIAVKTAYSSYLKVSLRAIKSLEKALREPQELFGRHVEEDELMQWEPFQIKVLEELENVAKKQLNPIIQLEIKDSICWQVKHGKSEEIKQKARKLFDALSLPFDNQLMQSLQSPFDRDWFIDEDKYDYQKATEMNIAFRQKVVNEFIKKYPKPEEGFVKLNQLLEDAKTCQKNTFSITFFSELAKLHTSYAEKIAELMIDNPDYEISSNIGHLLFGYVKRDPTHATKIAKRALNSKNEKLIISIADYYWRGEWIKHLIEEHDLLNLSLILNDKNIFAKKLAIGALGRLGKEKPDIAKKLLLKVELGNEKDLADEYCGQFDEKYYFDPNNLTDKELEIILEKLESISNIDNHNIEEFLEYLSERIPLSVIKFMIKRVEKSKIKLNDTDKYQPFSYLLSSDFKGIKSSSYYLDILREIRNKTIDNNWQSHFWYPILFKPLSGNFSQQSIGVLMEWIQSGEKDKIRAVGTLLHQAPELFIFQNPTFVTDMLVAAKPHGEKFYKSVKADLAHSAIFRSKHGTPGQPMPEDVELKDNSLDMLQKLPEGSLTYEFYKSLVEYAKKEIENQIKEDEEFLD